LKERNARLLLKEIKAAGIDFVICMPDSGLYALYCLIREDPDLDLLTVGNEGEGVCICAGAWMGGKHPLMLMENSGNRIASEYLAHLGISFGIPVLFAMSHRGSMGDGNWWAQGHGAVMEPLLKALRIPYTVLQSPEDVPGSFQKAQKTLQASLYPVGIVISGEVLW